MKRALLLVLLGLGACEGPYENCPKHYFSNDFKEYVVFNAGSKWVYEDSSSDIRNEINILNSKLTFKDRCDSKGEPEEILDQQCTISYFFNDTVKNVSAMANSLHYGYYFPMAGQYFDNPHRTNNFHLDSILIRGKIYKDLMVFIEPVNTYTSNRFYWSRKVGLVKSCFYDEKTSTYYRFELLNYELK